jgi:hypothetical protein
LPSFFSLHQNRKEEGDGNKVVAFVATKAKKEGVNNSLLLPSLL